MKSPNCTWHILQISWAMKLTNRTSSSLCISEVLLCTIASECSFRVILSYYSSETPTLLSTWNSELVQSLYQECFTLAPGSATWASQSNFAPGLYPCVTPRSCGYGNVTTTYIRRLEIPSRIYAKYQYRQESEYGSTVVIYILIEKYKYTVITGCNPIIQKYCIRKDAEYDYKV